MTEREIGVWIVRRTSSVGTLLASPSRAVSSQIYQDSSWGIISPSTPIITSLLLRNYVHQHRLVLFNLALTAIPTYRINWRQILYTCSGFCICIPPFKEQLFNSDPLTYLKKYYSCFLPGMYLIPYHQRI